MAPPLLVIRLLRQSHVMTVSLADVAVMIALVGAMFVPLGSTTRYSVPAERVPARGGDWDLTTQWDF